MGLIKIQRQMKIFLILILLIVSTSVQAFLRPKIRLIRKSCEAAAKNPHHGTRLHKATVLRRVWYHMKQHGNVIQNLKNAGQKTPKAACAKVFGSRANMVVKRHSWTKCIRDVFMSECERVACKKLKLCNKKK